MGFFFFLNLVARIQIQVLILCTPSSLIHGATGWWFKDQKGAAFDVTPEH